jgi:hypothetical protein
MNSPALTLGWRELFRREYRVVSVLSAVVAVLLIAWLAGYGNAARGLRPGAVGLALVAYGLVSRANGPVGQIDRLVRAAQALALVSALGLWLREAYLAASVMREWDFLSFYLDGRVASSGLNLYDPASYRQAVGALGITVTQEFDREILDVGFKYPPPTALIFFPLGLLKASVANAVWQTLVAVSILLSGVLSASLVNRTRLGSTVMLGVTLALCLDSAVEVQPFGQTLAMLACVALFALLDARAGLRTGVLTCLAVVIKPFMILPALLLLVARKWRAVAGALIAGACLIVASLLVFGPGTWASFLAGGTAARIPAWQFSQGVNKSLLGVLLRATHTTGAPGEHRGVLAVYGILAVCIVGASLFVATRIVKEQFRLAYALVLVAAIIVYPGTLHYYAAMLLIPAMLIADARRTNDAVGWKSISLAVAPFVVVEFSVFTALLITWGLLMQLALRRREPQAL